MQIKKWKCEILLIFCKEKVQAGSNRLLIFKKDILNNFVCIYEALNFTDLYFI